MKTKMEIKILSIFVTGLFLFISQTAICQTESQSPTIKEIQKANGKIKIETYYPVDTTIFSSSKIYLDSNFKVTKHQSLDGKYFITKNVAYGWLDVARLFKKTPHKVIVDSMVQIEKEYNLSIQYTRIINGQIVYKWMLNSFEFKVENGMISHIKRTNRKGTKIKGFTDFSGLYQEKNKTWPTSTIYHKNGNIKSIESYLFYNKTLYGIVWKLE